MYIHAAAHEVSLVVEPNIRCLGYIILNQQGVVLAVVSINLPFSLVLTVTISMLHSTLIL